MNKHPLAQCEHCTLRNEKYVPSTLPADAELTIVGEAPGEEEAARGAPFVGASGRLLRKLIEREGGTPAAVAFTNVVSCRPPSNRTPTPDEILCCRPRLESELGTKVLALGNTAAQALLGEDNVKIGAKRGVWHKRGDANVRVGWHPAYVLRKASELEGLSSDIHHALLGDVHSRRAPEVVFEVIDSPQRLQAVLDSVADNAVVAFDIETNQLQSFDRPASKADPILMLAFATSATQAYIVGDVMLYDEPIVAGLIQQAFSRFRLVGHNSKFDVVFLMAQLDIHLRVTYDTMLAHYTLNEMRGIHGLKELAKSMLGYEDYEAERVQQYLTSRNDQYGKVPFNDLAEYAAMDVCCTMELWTIFERRLKATGMWEKPFLETLMPASHALAMMEYWGIAVDVPALTAASAELEKEMEIAKADLEKIAGHPVNPASPKQLAALFYDELRFPLPRGRKMVERSTNKEAMAQMPKHPATAALTGYRRPQKIKSSYVDNLLEVADVEGRVHTNFMLHGTETGRLSARDPALQTIPRESTDRYGSMIRKAFIAPPGRKLVVCDYSSAELRVLAALSGEPFLIDVYENDRDLHSEAAKKLFGPNYTKEHRMWCKMLNFSYAYGGNEHSFAEGTGMPLETAREIVRGYDRNMPVARAWKAAQFEKARRQGYIDSVFGRRRRFPIIDNMTLEDVRKGSVNMPVQSAASDLTLHSCIDLIALGFKPVLTVHDSIIVECLEESAADTAEIARQTMVRWGERTFPNVKWKVDADVVNRWGE